MNEAFSAGGVDQNSPVNKTIKTGTVFEFEGEGLKVFEDFFTNTIKPEIEGKYGLKLHGLSESISSRISRGLTKYGIKNIKDVSVETLESPTDIGDKYIGCYAFKIQGKIFPKMPENDKAANGEKEFILIIKVKKGKAKVPSKPNKKQELFLTLEVASSLKGESKDLLRERIKKVFEREYGWKTNPLQGGLPGSGKRG